MIAMCGLDCNDCIAFIATQKNDDKLREKVVEAWSTEEEPLRLEDVGNLLDSRMLTVTVVWREKDYTRSAKFAK